MRNHHLMAVIAGALVATTSVATVGSANAASSHSLIQGSGSSAAANAINQWISDSFSAGLQVVYAVSSSPEGKSDFAAQSTDFAVSDLPYFGTDPTTGDADTALGRAYSSVPLVGSGTSFPYQIRTRHHTVSNLRLSGKTLARIFTGRIVNWDDPAVTADNDGHELPNLPIIPVVHSDGSGDTYDVTSYFSAKYPHIWKAYNGVNKPVDFYPTRNVAVGENGSNGVMDYVALKQSNGAIGMDEYSYALARNFPVAAVENAAHYYVLPTDYNVAIALQSASLDEDSSSPTYLQPLLDDVFTATDPRVYPLSSFASMFVPTSPSDGRMTTPKRQTINDFAAYSLCTGQSEAGAIGYGPLPLNLVRTGFRQLTQLHTADPNVDVSADKVSLCNDPTFKASHPTNKYLRKIAPLPATCARKGHRPCKS